MWDPSVSFCPVLGSCVCTTKHIQWMGFLLPGLGFPFGGRRTEWAAGYCCHNGSDHLNCLLSLWVHLQGFFSFTLWFLLCQTLSGICRGSGLSPVASVHSSLMLNAYVSSHWCLGDHGSGDPLAPGFCCVNWMDGGRAAVLESWFCLLMLDKWASLP